MIDWNATAVEAIKQLGGDETLVPGAKLRQRIHEIGLSSEADLREHLESNSQTFSDFLRGVPDIVMEKRRGTDMLVGLEGAKRPAADDQRIQRLPSHSPPRLRQDAYTALTRLTPSQYYYVRESDSFTSRPAAEENGIPVPQATHDGLVAIRRDFAEKVTESDKRERLLSSLNQSSNPLASFRNVVAQLGLTEDWASHLYKSLRELLEYWAYQNNLQPSDSWFRESGSRRGKVDRPQDILSRFAQYLTEDEARSVAVPFRAVEAMYRDISRRG